MCFSILFSCVSGLRFILSLWLQCYFIRPVCRFFKLLPVHCAHLYNTTVSHDIQYIYIYFYRIADGVHYSLCFFLHYIHNGSLNGLLKFYTQWFIKWFIFFMCPRNLFKKTLISPPDCLGTRTVLYWLSNGQASYFH